eukprot:6471770-Amphidinium_carterae.1
MNYPALDKAGIFAPIPGAVAAAVYWLSPRTCGSVACSARMAATAETACATHLCPTAAIPACHSGWRQLCTLERARRPALYA